MQPEKSGSSAYDGAFMQEALESLGVAADGPLTCAFCGRRAKEWHMLVHAKVGGRATGRGPTLGNLVPSCVPCEADRGETPYVAWMRERGLERLRVARIEAYERRFLPTDVRRPGLSRAERRHVSEAERRVARVLAEASGGNRRASA